MYENVSVPTLVYSLIPFGYTNGKAVGGHKRMKSAIDPNQHDASPGLKERSGSIENIMDQIVIMKGNNKNCILDKFNRSRPAVKKSESPEQLTQILLQQDETVHAITCGALHTLVLTTKNRMFSCGFGEGYALGHEDL